MSRSTGFASHRVLLVLIASLVLVLSFGEGSSSATTLDVTCANLQTEINALAALSSHGEGDQLVLDGMCGASSENSGSYVLPAGSAFTLEGAPGMTSGFDATGLAGAQLQSPTSTSVGSLKLSNLTFENSSATSQGGLALFHGTGPLTLANDTFTDEKSQGASPVAITEGGKTCPATPGGSLVVEHSLFQEGTGAAAGLGLGAGGGMALTIACGLDPIAFDADTFSENTLTPQTGQPGSGGGLSIFNEDASNIADVTQIDNVFDSNAIHGDGTSSYVGGGEQAVGVDLTSTGDRFSRNTLPGTSATGDVSWGAGLSIEQNNCQPTSPASTLTDDVLAANTIADTGLENPAQALGAGVYVGVICAVKAYSNHLTLLDSTVTDNAISPAGTGAVAGIDGHSSDHLTLDNTILYGDAGGAELGGFTGEGGSLTATFSDVCAGGVTTSLAGEGNICANPMLADNGNPASFDVHETGSSPTIDAGSNALVPSGLTTDFYGGPRILADSTGCTGSFPAVVDMGASEYVRSPVAVPPCALQIHPPVPGLTNFISLKTSPKGVAVKLSCVGSSTQICSGTLGISVEEVVRGKKILSVGAGKKELSANSSKRTAPSQRVSAGLGQTTFSLAGGSTSTVEIKLNSTGIALLRQFHVLPTLVLGNEAIPNTTFLFLIHAARITEPKPKHKHKSKKHKSRHKKHH